MKAKNVLDLLSEVEDKTQRYSGRHIPPQYNFETYIEERRRKAREMIESNTSYLGTCKTIQDVKNLNLQENDWILRSADGDGNILAFDGNLSTEKDVNTLKTYYHRAQDVNYLGARPITYKRWLVLDDEHKLASRIKK